MGCAHASKILTVEDIEFIARNTAMTKAQVEVYHFIRNFISFYFMQQILQTQYQNFLKMHPDGRISKKSFHTMMKECYPGADTEKLERHIFRMYDSNKVETWQECNKIKNSEHADEAKL